MKCCVTIPVYKDNPSQFEIRSFRQCVNILRKHPICVFTYSTLDTLVYRKILERYGANFYFEYFDQSFFMGIEGYNRLMLSVDFYQRFAQYNYILIYQLDGYVFYDELDYWCNCNYSYIGAPLEKTHYQEIQNRHNKLSPNTIELLFASNGGVSLRRVKDFISTLETNVHLVDSLRCEGLMEDIIFSALIYPKTTIPSYSAAIRFAFESNPRKSFILNNRHLPMLCHGWYRIDSELYDADFWLRYIWPWKYIKRMIKKSIRKT